MQRYEKHMIYPNEFEIINSCQKHGNYSVHMPRLEKYRINKIHLVKNRRNWVFFANHY